MFFTPVNLGKVFSEEDATKLEKLVYGGDYIRNYVDDRNSRTVRKVRGLKEYSSKLLPIAREVFNDPTLKGTYNVSLSYDKTSKLAFHKDMNACVYTIDYCVSSNIDWPLIVEGQEFSIARGEALAFMGGDDLHGRNSMPDAEDARVEVVMFHFCPEDHWYFTEGPEYIKVLAERGEIPTY